MRCRGFLFFLLLLFPVFSLSAGDSGEWRAMAVVRFGNIDAIDAEEGGLASFLRKVRNDGRFTPPVRTLIGPEIRNPTLFGLSYEAWMEAVVFAPQRAGAARVLWVFPVDSRDEYMTHLANQGLAEYEGMDGVSVIRELDADGNSRVWYMEWLPGNVAVFGANRDAVFSAKKMYAEQGASRGLLAEAGGDFVEPDMMLRIIPPNVASWQNAELGRYWFRGLIDRLRDDLVAAWRPGSARVRLLNSLADELVLWPRSLDRVDLSLWLEDDGFEWRLDAAGDFSVSYPPSQFEAIRRLPERTAMAYSIPVSRQLYASLSSFAGRLLLDGAGGAVNTESRRTAQLIDGLLADGRLLQMCSAWVAPPAGRPELGGVRLLITEWEKPEQAERAWAELVAAVEQDSPVLQTLAQLGWKVDIIADSEVEGSAEIVVSSISETDGEEYYRAAFVARRRGSWMALVGGTTRADAESRRDVMEYRGELAAQCLERSDPGIPDVRNAFTRVSRRGASFLGILDPVRLLQFMFVEAADWRRRSPDQREPLSTQLAREMLEYGAAGSLSASGERVDDGWRFNGGISWESLFRLSAVLGITESIGVE